MAVEKASEFFDTLLPKRLQDKPEIVDQIGAVYKFVIEGDAGGIWLVDLTVAGGKIEASDGEAKCTITVADTDFVDIIKGTLNAQMAFMGGKLKVAGDMGLAMKLTALFG